MAKALESLFIFNKIDNQKSKTPNKLKKRPNLLQTSSGGQELCNRLGNRMYCKLLTTKDQYKILRKVTKTLDDKNFKIAILQWQKRQLKLQIEDLQPKKKKKVIPSVRKRFVIAVQISAIQHLTEVIRADKSLKSGLKSVDLRDTVFTS